MTPVRECMRATHWKKVLGPNGTQCFTPCDPSYPGAIEMNLMDLEDAQKLFVPAVTREHFLYALTRVKPTVNKNELTIYDKFTDMYGQSGQVDPADAYNMEINKLSESLNKGKEKVPDIPAESKENKKDKGKSQDNRKAAAAI